MQPREYHSDNTYLIYDADVFPDAHAVRVDKAYWAQQDAIVGGAQGRGTVLFVEHPACSLVIRQYQRGGLIAKLSHAHYVWTGWHHSRCWREWQLLQHLSVQGLPVPQPVAARVVRQGPVYSAWLITQRIEHSESLASLLSARQTVVDWRRIGQTLARFHQAGAYHADLNAHNILLDEQSHVYIIDFDRGRLLPPAKIWQQRNLLRLQHSLNKLKQQSADFDFSTACWSELLAGYSAR